MRSRNRLVLASSMATLLSVTSAPVLAADGDTKKLSEITVKGEAMEESNQSFSVNVVDRKQLEARSIGDVLRAIEETPGMTMSAGAYAQGGVASAFQIRGFGGGGHGSDAAVYIDGISLNEGGSHGDGYADTNIIMPIEIEAMSIYKGPVSPLYGNFARGGTLAFETRKGGNYQEADVFIGAYNTVNAQMAVGGSKGPISSNFAVQSYDNDGYRENQEYSKQNVSGRVAYEINDDSEVALSIRNHAGHFSSPGYIAEAQFLSGEDGRRSQAANGENDGGSRGLDSFRLDYNTMLNDSTRLLAWGYRVEQESVRYAKFSDDAPSFTEVNGQAERFYSRDGIALGTSLNGESILAGKETSWVAGFEYFDETTNGGRYNTVNRHRVAVLTPDSEGRTTDSNGLFQHRESTTQTTSLFGQADIAVSDKLTSTLGLRYDIFDGDDQDLYSNTPSTSMEDYSHLSPKLGMRYSLSPNWQLRGSAANGFALPAGEAKYNASIQVDPVDYMQYEVGISGSPAAQWYIDVAAFTLESSGEYQEIGGQTVNSGETNRTGLEAEVRFNPATHLELIALLGVFDSEITANADAALVGKSVSSVPKQIATLKASYAPPAGLGGTVAWRSTGEYYISDDNLNTYDGFDVVDLTAFYNVKGNDEDGSMKVYAQINNLLDETYAEAVWGGANANYAPAAARNIGVGLTVKY